MTSILNTVFLKIHVVLDLSKKTNSNPNNLAKDIHFMKSALLLLSNSQFKSHENAGVKVDAVLKAYGLERVPVAKDGNGLFASVSFFLLQLLTTDGCSLDLQQHLNSIGITGDKTLPELIKLLRKLVVELGNAVNLALANVLRTSLVAFTSLENYQILTVFPKNDPVSNVPVYLAFEQIGPSYYDTVIQSGTNEELSQPKELTRPVCRCGQGAAKNKMTRKFCLEYKSGCKCYQNLKGCTSDCGCFNCANTFGVREESSGKSTPEIAIPRKRRKHSLGKETGRDFMIGRGENITRARWTLFEKLLCIECIANMENGDDDVNRLAGYYNNVVICLKNFCLLLVSTL